MSAKLFAKDENQKADDHQEEEGGVFGGAASIVNYGSTPHPVTVMDKRLANGMLNSYVCVMTTTMRRKLRITWPII